MMKSGLGPVIVDGVSGVSTNTKRASPSTSKAKILTTSTLDLWSWFLALGSDLRSWWISSALRRNKMCRCM